MLVTRSKSYGKKVRGKNMHDMLEVWKVWVASLNLSSPHPFLANVRLQLALEFLTFSLSRLSPFHIVMFPLQRKPDNHIVRNTFNTRSRHHGRTNHWPLYHFWGSKENWSVKTYIVSFSSFVHIKPALMYWNGTLSTEEVSGKIILKKENEKWRKHFINVDVGN